MEQKKFDELSQGTPEYTPQAENKVILENQIIRENVPVSEVKTANEYVSEPVKKSTSERKLKQEKKNHALSVLSGGLAATVGLVVAGMTTMVNVKMSAEFEDVIYEDGKITYSVHVEDMTEDETLTIYYSQDNKNMDPINLVDDDGDGIIHGTILLDKEYIQNKLDSGENVNIKYVLDLKGVVGLNVERSFDRFVTRIDKMTSKFENVESWCNCGVDGCYYFQLNFVDDNQLFTDFTAWIEDDFGNTSYCTFSENLHDAQKIFVGDLSGSHGILHIRYLVDGVAADPIDIEIKM